MLERSDVRSSVSLPAVSTSWWDDNLWRRNQPRMLPAPMMLTEILSRQGAAEHGARTCFAMCLHIPMFPGHTPSRSSLIEIDSESWTGRLSDQASCKIRIGNYAGETGRNMSSDSYHHLLLMCPVCKILVRFRHHLKLHCKVMRNLKRDKKLSRNILSLNRTRRPIPQHSSNWWYFTQSWQISSTCRQVFSDEFFSTNLYNSICIWTRN